MNLILILFFAGLTAFSIGSVFLRFTNTLYKGDNWYGSKTKLAKGTPGGGAFLVSKNTLFDESLNLGFWHGHHEIISKREFSPRFISFSFNLEKGTYLAFEYNITPEKYDGVLISNDINFASKQFTAQADGKFIKSKALIFSVAQLINSNNNLFQAYVQSGILSAYLNKTLIFEAPITNKTKIGFRSSSGQVSIDNVTVDDADLGLWVEDFSNKRFGRFFFFWIFLSILVIFVIIFFIFRKKNNIEFILVMASLNSFIIFGLINISDRYIFSKLYYTLPFERFLNADVGVHFPNTMEFDVHVKKKMDEFYFSKFSDRQFKVLFIGTSQTWGSGALNKEDAIPEQFLMRLQEKGFSSDLKVFNMGIQGWNSRQLYEYLETFGEKFPDYAVIILGRNDFYSGYFKESLEKLILLCKNKGLTAVLVQEGVFVNEMKNYLEMNHLIQEELALKYSLKIIPLHRHLLDKRETGFLWWDEVHMTSYGMNLAADLLANELAGPIEEELIRKLRKK